MEKILYQVPKQMDVPHQNPNTPTTWEATEWLIGSSCSLMWTGDMLCAGSAPDERADDDGGNFLDFANSLGLPERLKEHLPGRFVSFRGVFVGPGIINNPYKLSSRAFYCFDIYDSNQKRYLTLLERNELTTLLGINSCPVVSPELLIPKDLKAAMSIVDGPSQLLASQKRFGLYFNCNNYPRAFKLVSIACVLELQKLRKNLNPQVNPAEV